MEALASKERALPRVAAVGPRDIPRVFGGVATEFLGGGVKMVGCSFRVDVDDKECDGRTESMAVTSLVFFKLHCIRAKRRLSSPA